MEVWIEERLQADEQGRIRPVFDVVSHDGASIIPAGIDLFTNCHDAQFWASLSHTVMTRPP